MDRILIEMIRRMQWPSEEVIFSKSPDALRRPSPFWIQKKIKESLNPGNREGKKRLGIESKFRYLDSAVKLNAVIDTYAFGYHRRIISYPVKFTRIEEAIEVSSKYEFVEYTHFSLVFSQSGRLRPFITFEIIYSDPEDLNKKTKLLSNLVGRELPGSTFEGEELFEQYISSSRKRITNGGRAMKDNIKNAILALLRNPLISIPKLANEIGAGRSTTKRIFNDLVRGGLILLEPMIDSTKIAGMTLSVLTVNSRTMTKEQMIRAASDIGDVENRIFITKKYYKNTISFLCWTDSYFDLISVYSTLVKKNIPGKFYLSWQFKTIKSESIVYPFLT